jgi:hypothetical protein
MSVCDTPFNTDFSGFNATNDTDDLKKYVHEYNKCLEDKINSINGNMTKIMRASNNPNDAFASAEQINEDTMKLYTNDYYYVITKGIVYLLIMGGFIYFFGISNLINGIKTTGELVKNKVNIIKKTANVIKDNPQLIKNMVNTTNPLPIKERVQQVKKTIEEKLDNDKNQ